MILNHVSIITSPLIIVTVDIDGIIINPNYGHQFGGAPVIISGPCYKLTDDIQCLFGKDKMVDGVIIDTEEALCISPMMEAATPVTLELYINGVAVASTVFSVGKHYTYSIIV